MECDGRSPNRSIEQVASGSSEPPTYRRRKNEEQKDSHRKRKAEVGSIQEEEMEGRVKSRMSEEEKDRRKQEGASKASLKREGGETRGDIDKTMDVDMMEEAGLQERELGTIVNIARSQLEKSLAVGGHPEHRWQVLHLGDAEEDEQCDYE